jgi:hypothetical protein
MEREASEEAVDVRDGKLAVSDVEVSQLGAEDEVVVVGSVEVAEGWGSDDGTWDVVVDGVVEGVEEGVVVVGGGAFVLVVPLVVLLCSGGGGEVERG